MQYFLLFDDDSEVNAPTRYIQTHIAGPVSAPFSASCEMHFHIFFILFESLVCHNLSGDIQ